MRTKLTVDGAIFLADHHKHIIIARAKGERPAFRVSVLAYRDPLIA